MSLIITYLHRNAKKSFSIVLPIWFLWVSKTSSSLFGTRFI